jgi:RsiW-degrading membrane proteinase PrsW (M82 family)
VDGGFRGYLGDVDFFAGPIEEGTKVLFALLITMIVPKFRTYPLFWFVGFAACGGGFGLVEDLFAKSFLAHFGFDPISQFLIRAASLPHQVMSGFIGWTLYGARLQGQFVPPILIFAWAAVSLFHGSLDALCFAGMGWFALMLFAGIVSVGLWRLWRCKAHVSFPEKSAPA